MYGSRLIIFKMLKPRILPLGTTSLGHTVFAWLVFMIQKISYGWVTVGKIYKEFHYVQDCQILSKTYYTCFCSNILQSGLAQLTNVTIMYRNNELSSTMS